MPLDHTALPPHLAEIHGIVGDKGLVLDVADMEGHLVEWRGLWRGKAQAVVKPGTPQEVAAVLKVCHDHRVAVVPQGGNTSLCGGSVPQDHGQEIVLSTVRLNKVRALDPLNYTMTVDAGCVLESLHQAALEADRFFPLSLAAQGTCQIGGNLSTNAGGVNVLRYGNTRDLVLGLEVALPTGELWEGLRGLRKDNTGYDLKHLFIGAEGTLGIITGAVLKLFPRPRHRATAFLAVPDPETAIALLAEARAHTADSVSSFELIPRLALDFVLGAIEGAADPLETRYDHYVLMEVVSTATGESDILDRTEAFLGEMIERDMVLDGTLAQSDAQADALWKLRESISEAQKAFGASIKHDISVPVSRMPDFLRLAGQRVLQEIPGTRICAFGHAGDGNVHFNLSRPEDWQDEPFLAAWERMARVVHDTVAEFNGSISAEHGLGRLKRDEVLRYKSETEMTMMRGVKKLLDPHNIMNPGKVLDV